MENRAIAKPYNFTYLEENIPMQIKAENSIFGGSVFICKYFPKGKVIFMVKEKKQEIDENVIEELKQKMELNKKLKELVQTMNRISKEQVMSRYYYDKFADLIENGATCKITKRLTESIFIYKFRESCRLAEEERCQKRKGYEHVEYLLGDRNTAYKRLKKFRPDLYQAGIQIVKDYLEESIKAGRMASWKALSIHRKMDSGNYEWENIDFLPVDEHRKLTSKPQHLIKFTNKGIELMDFPNIRTMAEHLKVSDSFIYNLDRNTMPLIKNPQKKGKLIGYCYWYDKKTIKKMKKLYNEEFNSICEKLYSAEKDSISYQWYSIFYEILRFIGCGYGFHDEEIAERNKPLDYEYKKAGIKSINGINE